MARWPWFWAAAAQTMVHVGPSGVHHITRREIHMPANHRACGGRAPARAVRQWMPHSSPESGIPLCGGWRPRRRRRLTADIGGQRILGDRTQPFETTINTQNINQLKPKWVFTMNVSQGESATPTVADGIAYFPGRDGYLYAVNAGLDRKES